MSRLKRWLCAGLTALACTLSAPTVDAEPRVTHENFGKPSKTTSPPPLLDPRKYTLTPQKKKSMWEFPPPFSHLRKKTLVERVDERMSFHIRGYENHALQNYLFTPTLSHVEALGRHRKIYFEPPEYTQLELDTTKTFAAMAFSESGYQTLGDFQLIKWIKVGYETAALPIHVNRKGDGYEVEALTGHDDPYLNDEEEFLHMRYVPGPLFSMHMSLTGRGTRSLLVNYLSSDETSGAISPSVSFRLRPNRVFHNSLVRYHVFTNSWQSRVKRLITQDMFVLLSTESNANNLSLNTVGLDLVYFPKDERKNRIGVSFFYQIPGREFVANVNYQLIRW